MLNQERVGVGIWKMTLGTPEIITPVSARCSKPALDRLPPLPNERFPFLDSDISFRLGSRGCVVEMAYNPEERIFGLGLQLKSQLQSGKKKHLRVNADPVVDSGDSHAPVPFFASSKGYAVFVDTARYLSIYSGTHIGVEDLKGRMKEKQTSAPALSTGDLYKAHSIGDKIILDIPAARGVTLYVFAGPDLRTAVSRYNLFSGGGCLPPLWSLGNWYRTFARHSSSDVLTTTDSFMQEDLPFSVIGLEPGWQSAAYPNSLAWSKLFPEPGEFAAHLKKNGYHLNLWEHAFVHPDASFAEAIQPYCGNFAAFDGLVPDFLDRTAKEIFAQQHDSLVKEGASGFKVDECDNSDFVSSAWSFPEHSQFPSGADGEQMHCLYGVHYQHTIDDVFIRFGKRHFGLARSSGALASSLPFALYSDLYKHSDFLRGMTNAGFSGLLWSPEVRDAKSMEDLVRRLQSTIFSPVSLINAWYIPRPPWKQVDTDKNVAGVEMAEAKLATELTREILKFRMSLVPYLYTAFAKYHFSGVPPFRALAMDFIEDKTAATCDRQWMVGPDLLVAPFIAGETSLNVYLPGATAWREFSTGRLYKGGQHHLVISSGLSHIPLFVRDGALLPIAEPVQILSSETKFTIHPHVYAKTIAACELYADDGETYDYQEGKSAWSQVEWSPERGCRWAEAEGSSHYRSHRYQLADPVLLNSEDV